MSIQPISKAVKFAEKEGVFVVHQAGEEKIPVRVREIGAGSGIGTLAWLTLAEKSGRPIALDADDLDDLSLRNLKRNIEIWSRHGKASRKIVRASDGLIRFANGSYVRMRKSTTKKDAFGGEVGVYALTYFNAPVVVQDAFMGETFAEPAIAMKASGLANVLRSTMKGLMPGGMLMLGSSNDTFDGRTGELDKAGWDLEDRVHILRIPIGRGPDALRSLFVLKYQAGPTLAAEPNNPVSRSRPTKVSSAARMADGEAVFPPPMLDPGSSANYNKSHLNRDIKEWSAMRALITPVIMRKIGMAGGGVDKRSLTVYVMGASTGEEIARAYYEMDRALRSNHEDPADWALNVIGVEKNPAIYQTASRRLLGAEPFVWSGSEAAGSETYAHQVIAALNRDVVKSRTSMKLVLADITDADHLQAVLADSPAPDLVAVNRVLYQVSSEHRSKFLKYADRQYMDAILMVSHADASSALQDHTLLDDKNYLFYLPKISSTPVNRPAHGARMAHQKDYEVGYAEALARGESMDEVQLRRQIAEADAWLNRVSAGTLVAYYEGLSNGFASLMSIKPRVRLAEGLVEVAGRGDLSAVAEAARDDAALARMPDGARLAVEGGGAAAFVTVYKPDRGLSQLRIESRPFSLTVRLPAALSAVRVDRRVVDGEVQARLSQTITQAEKILRADAPAAANIMERVDLDYWLSDAPDDKLADRTGLIFRQLERIRNRGWRVEYSASDKLKSKLQAIASSGSTIHEILGLVTDEPGAGQPRNPQVVAVLGPDHPLIRDAANREILALDAFGKPVAYLLLGARALGADWTLADLEAASLSAHVLGMQSPDQAPTRETVEFFSPLFGGSANPADLLSFRQGKTGAHFLRLKSLFLHLFRWSDRVLHESLLSKQTTASSA